MDDVFVVELELGEDRDEDVARAEERERAEVGSGGVLAGSGERVVNTARVVWDLERTKRTAPVFQLKMISSYARSSRLEMRRPRWSSDVWIV